MLEAFTAKPVGKKILCVKTILERARQPGSLLLSPRCTFPWSPALKLLYAPCISCSLRQSCCANPSQPRLWWQAPRHPLKLRAWREPPTTARYSCHFQHWFWTPCPCRGDPKGHFPVCPSPAQTTACCRGTQICPVQASSPWAQAGSCLSHTGGAGSPRSAPRAPHRAGDAPALPVQSHHPPWAGVGCAHACLQPCLQPARPDSILKERPCPQAAAWSTVPAVNDRASNPLWYRHCVGRGSDGQRFHFHTCLCREICLQENEVCWLFQRAGGSQTQAGCFVVLSYARAQHCLKSSVDKTHTYFEPPTSFKKHN